MLVAVLGATGRTGHALVAELTRRGHTVAALARDPAKLADARSVRVVKGHSRDARALAELVAGADAVISVLGPVNKDATLHGDTAAVLIPVMREAKVKRFIGVSGAGVDVPNDRKSRRDRVVSKLIQTLGGKVVADKTAEYQAYAASDLDWTLVRPPRLREGSATGRVEHHAHSSATTTVLRRADLAAFLLDILEQGAYIRQAPLVAGAKE